MFSGSSSYIGGGGGTRPGPSAYGQQQSGFGSPAQQQQHQHQHQHQQQQQQQQQHQLGSQPTGMMPQPTGYAGAAGMQPQFTGYQAPPQQLPPLPQLPQMPHQYTGLPGQAQPQQVFQPQQMSLSAFQPPQALPQRTGQTSTQIAQSFLPTSSTASPAPAKTNAGARIPNIRLSFITVQDQARFEQLFKSAVGDGQALTGDKARDLLLRSKLPGDTLSQIWNLSDTTKSGQLLFPEFALAMYLCNLKLVGKTLPASLPERITNEVSSMVDIISFGVPDDAPVPTTARSNVPSFDTSIRQPQPQLPSNSQLLSHMVSQPTGFQQQQQPSFAMTSQTGLQQPQMTGYAPQQLPTQQVTGFQSQPTGTMPANSAAMGYTGPRPPMPPMPTASSATYLPLNAQPTGRPGQWGLVNAPASGLPNMQTLSERMMPQPGREGGYTTVGLSGNATIPWAVTKEEKRTYDALFRAWDGFNKGFIGGDVAIEILGQSGLPKPDLERVWTLADHGNKGRLDLDEFAVAMHLIYRKLNNYDIPNRLPPELVPPSARNFSDSIGTVKSLLSQDAASRKTSGAALLPQRTGVSYMKSRSFREPTSSQASDRKDATVFKNNDDDAGYRSSARRRLGRESDRSPSPGQPRSSSRERLSDDLTLDQLRKRLNEKHVLLDALDFDDEKDGEADDALDRRDRRDAEELHRRIRRIQGQIDRKPGVSLRSVDTSAERRSLKRQLQALTDRLPQLASDVRATERDIAEAQLALFRLKDAKAHPESAAALVGSGPGGTVTESDRLKARAKAMMQQRSAALTGKPLPAGAEDASAAPQRLEAENQRVRTEKENNERMVRDVEDSVREFGQSLEDNLKDLSDDTGSEHERRRWEDGLGVEDEVKEFILDLERSSRSARVRTEDESRSSRDRSQDQVAPSLSATADRPASGSRTDGSKISLARPAATSSSTGGSYASYQTAEERAAFIKQQAEQRMNERLAALGLKAPVKSGESVQQRQEREAKEREDRIRQAEEEDTKRESERQRRLQDETIRPPSSGKATTGKKPPPPPTRKAGKPDPTESVRPRAASGTAPAPREQTLHAQQHAQKEQTRHMESEADSQEAAFVAERTATQARLAALEEQVKAGKLQRSEERRRKRAAEKDAQENEARLAAQRAEIEAAKERERELQAQLEQLDDEDSDEFEDAKPQQIITPPSEATPAASLDLNRERVDVATSQVTASSPAPASISASATGPSHAPAAESTNNPFLRKLASQPAPDEITSTLPPPTDVSTNPFHRFTNPPASISALPSNPSRGSSTTLPPPSDVPTNISTTPRSRHRPEEDDWSVVSSSSSSSSSSKDEYTSSGRSGAKHLASILFGTMAPPRPLSAAAVAPGGDTSLDPTSPIALRVATGDDVTDRDATAGGSRMSQSEMGESMGIPTINAPIGAPPAAPPPPPPPTRSAAPPPPAGGPPPPPPGGPPPPPLPSGAGASQPTSIPAFNRGGLLGEIAAGKGLKKVVTKDRSTSSSAGKVLG